MSKNNGVTMPRASTRPAKVEGSEDPFVYVLPIEVDQDDAAAVADVTVTVASLAKPFNTAGELRKMRNTSPLNLAFYLIERDCTAAQQEFIDELSMDEFNDFSEAWAEHSGIPLGK